jgi:transposase
LFINSRPKTIYNQCPSTTFVKNEGAMVSKEELHKRSKDELVDMVYDLILTVKKLTDEVKVLKEEIRVLKSTKNSGNSSLPPSHDLFKFRNQSLREKSGKKSGGQPGHKGGTLLMSPSPDETIEHWPERQCPQCGKFHAEGPGRVTGRRQVIDIPVIKAIVTEHRVFQTTCTCGHIASGNFPAGVSAPVQYGNNLVALTAYLSARQYVPYFRLSEMIASITNISMSQGTIFNLVDRAANMLMPVYKAIKEEVENALTVGGDETGSKVKGEKYWAWTWQTALATFIAIKKSRGFVTIANIFPNGFPKATYVSDSFGAQLKTFASRHQLCLAHLLRELNYFGELYNNSWATDMKSLLKRAITLKNKLAPEQYTGPMEERDKILAEFEILVNSPFPEGAPKMVPFQKRLQKRSNQIFTFLFFPDVPHDNNGSERAIRNIKVKQKVSGGFRSERGAEIFAILRSVVDTVIKKGGDPYEDIRFTLNLYS